MASASDVAQPRAHLGQPDGTWIIAEVEHRAGLNVLTPEDPAVKPVELPASEPLMLVNDLPEDGIEDMTQLSHLHEAAIVHNLGHRLARRHVYTDVGQITIALNPFCWETSKPLYEPEVRRRYRREDAGPLPPHLFALAERTHREVRRAACDQTVLISGESGAGKTESVKLIMHYLSSCCEDARAESKAASAELLAAPGAVVATAPSVADRVLATNPLLEAFGNAATLRNANSSRFGKFILLRFAADGHSIRGAAVQVYLLEKSRVVRRQRGERSYHIFYQMLHGESQNPSGLPGPTGAPPPVPPH